MINDKSLDTFLAMNRIAKEQWEKSNCDWPALLDIAADHEANIGDLSESAEFFTRVVQKFDRVHSVRWRVKDSRHLLAKIVRKRADGEEKYHSITPSNYFQIVTDLVGIRALHLFKADCFEIDQATKAAFELVETPIAYIRQGDPEDLTRKFEERKFEIKSHPAGYRSIHYVFVAQPIRRKVAAELQVRTIFEEGWSEIDHKVRYPSSPDSALVNYFLTIFNRLAGSADEMGEFVQGLTTQIQDFNAQIVEANRARDETYEAMKRAVVELTKLKKQDSQSQAAIKTLEAEVEKLKSAPSLETMFRNQPKHNPLADLLVRDIGTTTVFGAGLPHYTGLGIADIGSVRIGLETTSTPTLNALSNLSIVTRKP